MECPEARRLLERGVAPGSSTPERSALGFHLAGCPACRAFRASMNHSLLASLLSSAAPPATPAQAVPPPPVSPPSRSWRATLSHALWYGGLGLLAAFALAVVITLGWAALAILHTHRNVQAMIVPTVAASPSAPPSPTPAATAPAPTQAATLAATQTLAPTLTFTPLPATATALPPTATILPTPEPASPTPIAPPAGAPMTVLILGSDERPGESDPARTDAIIVARIDPQQRHIALLSLPRDLWVAIPGYGHGRINAANVWGVIYDDPEGGLGLARKTVSHLLGIPIDYTLHINFQGFIGAIDSIGGITVDVPKELYDDQFPTMDYGYTVAHFLPGPQQMDGATALMYSRIRHPDSDFARMRRQQAVLLAVMTRLREQNALQSLKSLEDMTTALREYVQTDIPEERMIGLAWALRDAVPERVQRLVLDEESISFGVGDDRWAEVADPGTLESLAQQLIGP